MKKVFFVILLTLNVGTIYATNNDSGHITTIDGSMVRDAFGKCIHAGFYDSHEEPSECMEIDNKVADVENQ